jgi:hypothetical protein
MMEKTILRVPPCLGEKNLLGFNPSFRFQIEMAQIENGLSISWVETEGFQETLLRPHPLSLRQ